MKSRTWQLQIDPAQDGGTNMKVDQDLLRDLEASSEPRTVVRFYSWVRPTLTLGRNQRPERGADLEFCARHDIDVIPRPTGGLAVLHDDEITYAVISNEPDSFEGGSVYGTYRRVSEALAQGYQRLGVKAALAHPTSRNTTSSGEKSRQEADDPCFVSQSRYELTVDGRKLVGSAQRRLRHAFLQHGSMPLSIDRTMLAGATRFDAAESLAAEVTALDECLDRVPNREELIGTFVGAFEEYFQVELCRPSDGKRSGSSRGSG